jgi:hypothetical protein
MSPEIAWGLAGLAIGAILAAVGGVLVWWIQDRQDRKYWEMHAAMIADFSALEAEWAALRERTDRNREIARQEFAAGARPAKGAFKP